MELQRIQWSWDTLIDRLRDGEPDISRALERSCRPMEAERRSDGWLLLVLGCWWRPDLTNLNRETQRERLGTALGRMLEERLKIVVVPWPGGMADAVGSEGPAAAPDLLEGLPPEAREEAALCESPVQRYFFAQVYRKGLRPRCQFELQGYRTDFAFPEHRVAVDVVGWDWHRRGRGAGIPRDREEQIGMENWRVRWFSGGEVATDVDRCLDELSRLLVGGQGQGLMTRRFKESRSGTGQNPRNWPRYQRRPFRK